MSSPTKLPLILQCEIDVKSGASDYSCIVPAHVDVECDIGDAATSMLQGLTEEKTLYLNLNMFSGILLRMGVIGFLDGSLLVL